jgi:hypothetical protein
MATTTKAADVKLEKAGPGMYHVMVRGTFVGIVRKTRGLGMGADRGPDYWLGRVIRLDGWVPLAHREPFRTRAEAVAFVARYKRRHPALNEPLASGRTGHGDGMDSLRELLP